MQRLEAFIDEHQENSESLYDAASAYSIVSGIYHEKDIARSKVYAERAVSLIRQAVEQGYSDFSRMQTDADLDPIRDVKGFIDIMQASNVGLRYAAVWNNSTWLESRQSHGLSPTGSPCEMPGHAGRWLSCRLDQHRFDQRGTGHRFGLASPNDSGCRPGNACPSTSQCGGSGTADG